MADVDRAQPLVRRRGQDAVVVGVMIMPISVSLRSSISMWSARGAVDVDLAAADADGGEVRRGLDAVGHDPVGDRPQRRRVDAVDHERRRADARRSRRPSRRGTWHRSTISGSRAALSSTVVPLATTAAMRMFSVAPTLGNSRVMSAPSSTSARRLEVAVAQLERRPHRLEAGEVHVDRAGAEVVAAGQRELGVPEPAEQRAEHVDRRPDLLGQLVGRLGRDRAVVAQPQHHQVGRVDGSRSHAHAPRAGRTSIAHVGDARHVGELVLTVRQQRWRP